MNEALKRGVRTFAQGFLGVLVLVAVPAGQDIINQVAGGGAVEFDFNVWRSIGIAAIFGGFIGIVSWAYNALEDVTGKSLLK